MCAAHSRWAVIASVIGPHEAGRLWRWSGFNRGAWPVGTGGSLFSGGLSVTPPRPQPPLVSGLTVKAEEPKYKKDKQLNEKISLFRGDITKLEVDAIVNAGEWGSWLP